MPTDLDEASARKRAEQAHAQTEITMMLFWFIICFGCLGCCSKSLDLPLGNNFRARLLRPKALSYFQESIFSAVSRSLGHGKWLRSGAFLIHVNVY
jgi:hypothetical protein